VDPTSKGRGGREDGLGRGGKEKEKGTGEVERGRRDGRGISLSINCLLSFTLQSVTCHF